METFFKTVNHRLKGLNIFIDEERDLLGSME